MRRCLSAGGEENYGSFVGQFLRIRGHMLENIGYTCEAMSVVEVVGSHKRGGRQQQPPAKNDASFTNNDKWRGMHRLPVVLAQLRFRGDGEKRI